MIRVPFTTNGITFEESLEAQLAGCPSEVTVNRLNRPLKAHETDAAYDLCACENVRIHAGETKLVKSGLSIALPLGYAGLVLPRSSLPLKHGLTIPNAPGLIDSGYRGDIGIILSNPLTFEDICNYAHARARRYVDVRKGERYAQLLVVRAEEVEFVFNQRESFYKLASDRGTGGFGSTDT